MKMFIGSINVRIFRFLLFFNIACGIMLLENNAKKIEPEGFKVFEEVFDEIMEDPDF